MKKTIVILCAALALSASLAACQQKGAARVAVLDPNKVFTSCDACKQGGEYLRSLGQGLQQELTEMQASMKDDKSEDAPMKFPERYQEIQQKMVGEQTRIAGTLDETFQKVMTDYRAKNSVDVILNKENVLSFDETQDATDSIIAAMNAAAVDLQLPATDEEKAEEAAPAEVKEEKKAE